MTVLGDQHSLVVQQLANDTVEGLDVVGHGGAVAHQVADLATERLDGLGIGLNLLLQLLELLREIR
jgi:hypothetical protein